MRLSYFAVTLSFYAAPLPVRGVCAGGVRWIFKVRALYNVRQCEYNKDKLGRGGNENGQKPKTERNETHLRVVWYVV
jgi:hypothetical protein